MRYQVISQIQVDGLTHKVGAVVDLSESDAETFLSYGAVEPYIQPFAGGKIVNPAPESQKFGKLHQQIVKAANELRAQIADIDARLDLLQNDRKILLNGVINKADYLEILRRDIRRQSAPYVRQIEKALSRNGYTTMANMQALDEKGHAPGIPYLTGDGLTTHIASREAMLYLFEDQIMQRMTDILDGMKWPEDTAPMEQRSKMLEAMDDQIVEILQQRDALVEEMDAAGIKR